MDAKYRKFYVQYFPQLPQSHDREEVQVCCPFHDDNDPSFSINLVTGLWKCFGPCQEGGDAYSFYQKMYDCSFPAAKREVDKFMSEQTEAASEAIQESSAIGPIAEENIIRWHKLLMTTPNALNFLYNERGYTKETIAKFKIGWDGTRITIPIYDERGLCMNVRRYLPKGKGQNKMINYKRGYGKARLFNIGILKEQQSVLLCEGEMDCILANQMGLQAVSTTGGAGTWLLGWSLQFKDKVVYICYDIDPVGRDGAMKVARALFGVAKKVYIIDLPLTEPKNADVTDYFVKHGYTLEDFKTLAKEARLFNVTNSVTAGGELQDEDIVEVSLFDARLAKFRGRKVRMNVLVVGKDLAPYTIPRKVKFKCTAMSPDNKDCERCMLNLSGGEGSLDVKPGPRLLNLIRCTEQQQQTAIKSWIGIPKCQAYTQDIISPQNIEELLLAPEINYDTVSTSGEHYTIQRAFYVAGDIGSLRPNQTYVVEGVMAPDPWQQYVTFVLTSALPLQDSLGGFKVTDEIIENLKIFQLEPGQTVKEKFDEIHEQFTHNVTHIYGRNDLLTALDLVYHSVLQFKFQGIDVRKGWLECLIIGDTRTGKSESTERLMSFYRIGEFVLGENSTFAGLIGGMQQTQSRWFITWGKIPLNDGRLVVIDEASGLAEEDIARMSGVRSAGIAEITKIQTEKALARTRLIWISNPRSGRPLKTYPYGVEAISELIGKAEDISRFDFALSCASDEIPTEVINAAANTREVPELTYTADLCKQLIIWAWSRKSDDIVFEDDAIDTILAKAITMGKAYSTRIPLVEPANQRIKLARMAVAVAARLYSTDETGQMIIVKKEHVEFAYDFIEEIYAKPSLDYRSYSRQEKESENIAAQHSEEILKYISSYAELAELFLRQAYLRSSDIEEQLNVDKETARDHIHTLAQARMIDRTPHGYRKSPSFIMLLRKWKNGEMKANGH